MKLNIEENNSKKYRYLCVAEILNYLEQHNYYNTEELKYDWETKRIYIGDKEFIPKVEAAVFSKKYCVNATRINFQDAVYVLAIQNSPKPEEDDCEELDILCEPILNWLDKNNLIQVRVFDIITNVLDGKLTPLITQRSLEIRIGKCLKQLGWTKVRTKSFRYWIKNI